MFKFFHLLLEFNYPHILDLGDQYVEEKNDLQLSLMITKAPIHNSNLNRKIFLHFVDIMIVIYFLSVFYSNRLTDYNSKA